ncbi:hypothetical protein ACTXLV_00165 [Brachybacterium alimentarium]|uniref:hypothetical protein n=1 Tax=Brachybacterium alimentarium TaxID=47845 RepID=UPI003FD3BC5E
MTPERCVFHARTTHNADADELHPLSALERTDPRAFAAAIAKYDDTPERRRLRETWIPVLEATWTGVVFLSPIQPHAIREAWRAIAGVELPAKEFWAIPVEDLGPAIVFDRHLSSTGDPIDPQEIDVLDVAAYRSRDETTPRNAQWIDQLARAGKRGAWFNGTPHILTKGPVPLHSAEVIDWRAP